MFLTFCQSPRWLILTGRANEAMNVLAALDNAQPDDAIVYKEFLAIKDAVLQVGASGGFRSVFTNTEARHFHRTLLACATQWFQQFSGFNLVAQYLALMLVQQMHYNGWLARLLAGCIGGAVVIASLVPVVGIDRFWGRRSLMMFGASGMCVSMVVLTITRYINTTPTNIVSTVFLFIFQAFFVIGWQGMAWLYSAEIVPLEVRGPANALSSGANWLANFTVVLIAPLALNNIGYRTYIIFAATNAFILPAVYFFFPETAFRTLEEVDVFFFAAAHTPSGSPYLSVVTKSHEAPLWYGRDGQNDFDYERSEWHRQRMLGGRGSDEMPSDSSDLRSPDSSGATSDEKEKVAAAGMLMGYDRQGVPRTTAEERKKRSNRSSFPPQT